MINILTTFNQDRGCDLSDILTSADLETNLSNLVFEIWPRMLKKSYHIEIQQWGRHRKSIYLISRTEIKLEQPSVYWNFMKTVFWSRYFRNPSGIVPFKMRRRQQLLIFLVLKFCSQWCPVRNEQCRCTASNDTQTNWNILDEFSIWISVRPRRGQNACRIFVNWQIASQHACRKNAYRKSPRAVVHARGRTLIWIILPCKKDSYQ